MPIEDLAAGPKATSVDDRSAASPGSSQSPPDLGAARAAESTLLYASRVAAHHTSGTGRKTPSFSIEAHIKEATQEVRLNSDYCRKIHDSVCLFLKSLNGEGISVEAGKEADLPKLLDDIDKNIEVAAKLLRQSGRYQTDSGFSQEVDNSLNGWKQLIGNLRADGATQSLKGHVKKEKEGTLHKEESADAQRLCNVVKQLGQLAPGVNGLMNEAGIDDQDSFVGHRLAKGECSSVPKVIYMELKPNGDDESSLSLGSIQSETVDSEIDDASKVSVYFSVVDSESKPVAQPPVAPPPVAQPAADDIPGVGPQDAGPVGGAHFVVADALQGLGRIRDIITARVVGQDGGIPNLDELATALLDFNQRFAGPLRNVTVSDQADQANAAGDGQISLDDARELVTQARTLLVGVLQKIDAEEYVLNSRLPNDLPNREERGVALQNTKTYLSQFPLAGNAAISLVASFNHNDGYAAQEPAARIREASNANLALRFLSEIKNIPSEVMLPFSNDSLAVSSTTTGTRGRVDDALFDTLVDGFDSRFTDLSHSKQRDKGVTETTFPTVTGFVKKNFSKVTQLGSWRPSYLPAATRSLYSLATDVTSKMDQVKSLDADYSFKSNMAKLSDGGAGLKEVQVGAVETLKNILKGQKPGENFTFGEDLTPGVINAQEVNLTLLSMNLFLDGFRAVERSRLQGSPLYAATPNDTVMRLSKQDMAGKMDAFSSRKLQASYTGKSASRAYKRSDNLREAGLIASRQHLADWNPALVETKFDLAQSAVQMLNGLSSEQRRIYNPQVSSLLDSLQKLDQDFTNQGASLSINERNHILSKPSVTQLDELVQFKQQVFDTDSVAKLKVASFEGVAAPDNDVRKAEVTQKLVLDQSKQIFQSQRDNRTLLARYGTRASIARRNAGASASSAHLISGLRSNIQSAIRKEDAEQVKNELNYRIATFSEALKPMEETNSILKFYDKFLKQGNAPDALLEVSEEESSRISKVTELLKKAKWGFGLEGLASRRSSDYSAQSKEESSRISKVTELLKKANLLKKAKRGFGLEGLASRRSFDYSAQRLVDDLRQYAADGTLGVEWGSRVPGSLPGVLPGIILGLLKGDSRFSYKSPLVSVGVADASVVDLLGGYSARNLADGAAISGVIDLLNLSSAQADNPIKQRLEDLDSARTLLNELIQNSMKHRANAIEDGGGDRTTVEGPGMLTRHEQRQMNDAAKTIRNTEWLQVRNDQSEKQRSNALATIRNLNSVLCREAALKLSFECVNHAINVLQIGGALAGKGRI